jgi:hypothetical protein
MPETIPLEGGRYEPRPAFFLPLTAMIGPPDHKAYMKEGNNMHMQYEQIRNKKYAIQM